MDATFVPARHGHRSRGHRGRHWIAAAALACLAALLLGRGTRADFVHNDVRTNHPSGTMTIVVGTATTVTYWIQESAAGGDQAGCNADDGTPVTVDILTHGAAVVTPSSLVFDACEAAQSVTFVPTRLGTHLILVSTSDGDGGDRYDRTGTFFNLHVVPVTNGAPTVTLTEVTDGGSYPVGSVSPLCLVSDAEDGSTTFAATLSAVTGPLAGYGVGSQTASCAYTDTGGLSASASATYALVDDAAPVLTVPADRTVEATGPGGAVVVYDATAGDAVDGAPVVACDPASGATFGLGPTTVACTATDAAGNVAGAGFTVTVVDTTPPVGAGVPADATIEAEGADGTVFAYDPPTANDLVDGAVAVSCEPASGAVFPLGTTMVGCSAVDAAGNRWTGGFAVSVVDTTPPAVECDAADGAWHAADVGVACTASDGASGLAEAGDASFWLVTDVPDGTEDADAFTGSREVCDAAGNCATAGPVGGHRVDKKAQTAVVFVGFDGDVFPVGAVPPPPPCDATDGGAGLAACEVTGYGAAVGRHTLTATAIDHVGNRATATFAYEVHEVRSWTLKGFARPVRMDRINVVKGGATVRLKFEVFAGAVEVTDPRVVTLTAQRVSCGTGAAIGQPVPIVTGEGDLRYRAKQGRFVAKWRSPRHSDTTCWDVSATTDDGSSITASFKLKPANGKGNEDDD